MSSLRVVALAAAVLAFSGCYHATIDTGLAPSGETITEEWAHGFVYGLVPPETVDAAAACPNGVAQVDTQLSFLNQLASALTFGIYTPMTIEVQCAAASAMNDGHTVLSVPADASADDRSAALDTAAREARDAGAPVLVIFR